MTALADPPAAPLFLSYASADRERAIAIADRLGEAGIPVWLDQRNIVGGSSWDEAIVAAIRRCAVLAVLCSPAAMASPNILQELRLAQQYRKAVLPLLLETVTYPPAMEYILAGRQWIALLDHPLEASLAEILRALAALDLRPAPAAAAPPTPPPPGHLPAAVTSFVGREHDRTEVGRLLSACRLLTLSGMGGTGKTRLALESGRDLLGRFPDGVWLVELAPLADPALVVPAVASVLGVTERPGEVLVETLAVALAGRSLLLVLDNCEHLLEASAALVAALLERCRALRVLATSRTPLRLPGEVVYAVAPLALPPLQPNLPVAVVQEAEAVQLFVARAQAVRPEFALSESNATAVVQVCRQLDGIPLALELAAARLKVLAIGQLAERLADRFRLLTGGARTALPRQQTLRATLAWSYQLLSAAEQQLLLRLSVFAGGWTLEAAEQVCAGDGIETEAVLELLTQLIEHSLVNAAERAGEMRYNLLETVRQYAAEQLLEQAGVGAIREAHLRWYADLAEEAGRTLRGPQALEWLDRLEGEHDNLRAALAWGADAGSAEVGLRVGGALGTFWAIRGYLTEGRRWLEQYGEAVRNPTIPALVRARMLLQAAELGRLQGDYRAARVLYEESLALGRDVGDSRILTSSLTFLGETVALQGDYPAARALLEESLTIARALGNRVSIYNALVNLGETVALQGDYPAARALFEESLAIARALGDQWSIADSLCGLGSVARILGDYPVARNLLEESLSTQRHIGNKRGVALALNQLGAVAACIGDAATARRLCEESLDLSRDLGERRECARGLELLAGLAVADGQFVRAGRLLAAAAVQCEKLGAVREAWEQAAYERNMAAVRTVLGAKAEAAWTMGQDMTLEEATAYGLDAAAVD